VSNNSFFSFGPERDIEVEDGVRFPRLCKGFTVDSSP